MIISTESDMAVNKTVLFLLITLFTVALESKMTVKPSGKHPCIMGNLDAIHAQRWVKLKYSIVNAPQH